GGTGYRSFVGLALVAGGKGALKAAPVRSDARAIEHRGTLLLERGEHRLEHRGIGTCRRGVDRANVVALKIAANEPEGGKRTRDRRTEHLSDAKLARQRRDMQPPCTAQRTPPD